MIYAGIGSRETPQSILDAFTEIGRRLADLGIVLRSGRAPGADSAFEIGCAERNGSAEIFIPWDSFQREAPVIGTRPAFVFDNLEPLQKQKALSSIDRYHPAPEKLSQGARKLMARNYCQMFGPSVSSPRTDFIVCYTRDGRASGGTGQAIRMAEDAGITVLNAHGYEENPNAFVELVLNYVN